MLQKVYSLFPMSGTANQGTDKDSFENFIGKILELMVKEEPDPIVKGMLMTAESIFTAMTIDEYHWQDISFQLEVIDNRIDAYQREK